MKTIKKTMTLATLVLGMLMSFATDGISKGDYILVSNTNGEIIYNSRVNYDGNLKTHFDFSELSNGIYTIEIEKNYEIIVNTIEVKDSIVTYKDAKTKTILKPVLQVRTDKVFLSKTAATSEDLKINFFFNDALVHTEHVSTNNTVLGKIFKLDKAKKGNYKVVVTSNNRQFVEYFTL